MKKVIISIFAGLFLSVNAQTGWEVICNNYLDESFWDISYINEQNAWAVGSNGFIIHSEDGGIHWDVQFKNSDAWFNGCFFLDDQTGWVVGWDEVYHTEDGGDTWEQQDVPDPLQLGLNEVFFINQDTGWIAGDYQTIYATFDGGENWFVQNPYVLPDHICFQDIFFYDKLHGMAVGDAMLDDYRIARITNNGGNTWEDVTIPSNYGFSKVYHTDNGFWWVADERSNLFKSDDNGLSWEKISVGNGSYLKGMHFFNNDSAVIMSSGSRFHITSDGWNTWNDVVYYYGLSENAMDFCDDDKGIAIGWETETITTKNGGYDWLKKSSEFYDIGFFDEYNGWLINGHPNKDILHTTDGGITWNFVETPNSSEVWFLHFPTNNTGYIHCKNNELMKTTDAGNNWTIINLPDSITGFAHFINQDTGFMCSYYGYFSKTYDGGESWSSVKVNDSINLRTVFFLDENEGWMIGNYGFYTHTTDGGETWESGFLDVYYPTDICFTNNLNGFITTYQGYLYKTDDGGESWQKMDGFEYPLIKITFTDSLNGWLINDYNSIYHTTDGGETWEIEYSFEEYGITDIFFLNNENGWACNDKGIIAKYGNSLDIKNQTVSGNLVIYPNPANDRINIRVNSNTTYPLVCQIYTTDGKLMRSHIYKYENEPLYFNVTDFQPGLYFIKLISKENESVAKFIKN